MANAGQAILSIGGAAIGWFIGGPAGAAWGFQLGGMAGQAAFPTDLGTVNGPRLNDLSVQTSTVGAPIPVVFGTYALSGNLIWSSGIIETVTRHRQGGKGGPTQTVKEYTYSVDCAIGICEGPIGSITRIWADAKLIYDARVQQDGETDDEYGARNVANATLLTNTEFYLGTDTQAVDPTIESYEGVGNVSAFRDLVYVVFSDFQLADYGNRIPNFRFEVSDIGFTCTTVSAWDVTDWIPKYIDVAGTADARAPLGVYRYNSTFGVLGAAEGVAFDDGDWTTSLAAAVASKAALAGHSLSSAFTTCRVLNTSPYPADHKDPGFVHPDTIAGAAFNRIFAEATLSAVAADSQWFPEWMTDLTYDTGVYAEDIYPRFGFSVVQVFNDLSDGYEDGRHSFICQVQPRLGESPPSSYNIGGVTADAASGLYVIGGDNYTLVKVWDDVLAIEALPQEPPPMWMRGTATEVPGIYLVDGVYVSDAWQATLVNEFGQQMRAYNRVTGIRSAGPVVPDADPLSGDMDYWLAAYATAVADGEMQAGLTYGVHYPQVVESYYEISYEICVPATGATSATLGSIVREVCLRCGLTADQVDVTDLTESVDGYAITRPMSGRDAIAPLRSYGWFDCVESDGVLKWPTRGKAAVATLTADDLAAHVSGDSRPSAVETQRAQEVELPRRLRVHYAQTAQNYEPGEQGASRLTAGNVEERDLEVAVAMSDTKAAQIAEVVLYDLWVSRTRHRVIVDHSWLALEPADAITVPVDGRQERLRITGIDHSIPGLLSLDCVRDDDGVYESYAIGAPNATAGSGGSAISIVGTASLVLMDLPALRDADDDAGYYAAIEASGSTSFAGAVLYRSPDGGTTYEQVATTNLQGTIGNLVGALPSGPTTIIDEGNTLTVDGLSSTALESISEASLLAGLNAAAIGADGRWEIIQFRDAVYDAGSPPSWTLTGLLRGRRGTEWAVGTSQDNDSFVLLDSAVMRVPMNIAGIGASRPHKAVLVGTSLEAATPQNFTGRGVALEPFSPVHVAGTRSGNDLVMTWIRRGRLGQELPGNADIPLSEESEAYEIDVMDGVTVVRTITAATQTATYTGAQQTTDFGSPQASITVRVYQLSAVVGRGYVAEATL